ncbi:MAG: hypothetical protein RIS76_680 [Verrucomicrobiota bacterium]
MVRSRSESGMAGFSGRWGALANCWQAVVCGVHASAERSCRLQLARSGAWKRRRMLQGDHALERLGAGSVILRHRQTADSEWVPRIDLHSAPSPKVPVASRRSPSSCSRGRPSNAVAESGYSPRIATGLSVLRVHRTASRVVAWSPSIIQRFMSGESVHFSGSRVPVGGGLRLPAQAGLLDPAGGRAWTGNHPSRRRCTPRVDLRSHSR